MSTSRGWRFSLDDENAGKSGPDDKRCTMEAQLAVVPIAVTHHASTLREATAGALEKLTRMMDATLGKQRNQKRHPADLSLPGSTLAEE